MRKTMEMVHECPTELKWIAVTFDDGPDPLYTPRILDILRDSGASATFYMVGEMMEQHPDIVRMVFTQGHEIGSHTYTHPYLTRISEEERLDELRRTEEIICSITGSKPTTFRPPYLDFNGDVARAVEKFGYQAIGAVNMEAQDWAEPGVDHIVAKSREQIRNGSILLFHDGFGNRAQTVEAMRILVPELTMAGYRLVTVSELLERYEHNEDN